MRLLLWLYLTESQLQITLEATVSSGFSYNLRYMHSRHFGLLTRPELNRRLTSLRLNYSFRGWTWKIWLLKSLFAENSTTPAVNIQPLIFLIPAFAASGFLSVVFITLLRICHTDGVVTRTTSWLTLNKVQRSLASFWFSLSVQKRNRPGHQYHPCCSG